MSTWTRLSTPTESELVVGVYDLTGYTVYSERTEPPALLKLITDYHALIGGLIADAGGILIKPIGDAGLFAFFAEHVDTAVTTAHRLIDTGDAWLRKTGYPGRTRMGMHLGPVAIGRIGAPGDERLDIIGKTVNVVAQVERDAYRLSITPSVFRRLSSETRKLFRKHTPPISYIAVGDPQPRAYGRGFATGGGIGNQYDKTSA